MRLPFEQPDITPAAPQYGGGPMVQASQAMDVSGPSDQMSRGIENLMATIDGGSKIYKTWKEADRNRQWDSAMELAVPYYKDRERNIKPHINQQSDGNISPDNATDTIDQFLTKKIKGKDEREYNLDDVENSIQDDVVKQRFKTWRNQRSGLFHTESYGKLAEELFARISDSIVSYGNMAANEMLQSYLKGEPASKQKSIWDNSFEKRMQSLEGIEVLSQIQNKNARKKAAQKWVTLKFTEDYGKYSSTDPTHLLKGIANGDYDFKHGEETTSFDTEKNAGYIRKLLSRQTYIDETLKLSAMKSLISGVARDQPGEFLAKLIKKSGPEGKKVRQAVSADKIEAFIKKDYGFEPNEIQVQEIQTHINGLIQNADTALKKSSGVGTIKTENWPSKLREHLRYQLEELLFEDTTNVDPLAEYSLSQQQRKDLADDIGYIKDIKAVYGELDDLSEAELNEKKRELFESSADDKNKRDLYHQFEGVVDARIKAFETPIDTVVTEVLGEDALIDLNQPLDLEQVEIRSGELGIAFEPMPETDVERFSKAFDRKNLNLATLSGLEGQFKARYGSKYYKGAMRQFLSSLREDNQGHIAALIGIQEGMSATNKQAAITALTTPEENLIGIDRAEDIVRQFNDDRDTYIDTLESPAQIGDFVRLVAHYARTRIGTNASTEDSFPAVKDALSQLFAHWTVVRENGVVTALPKKVWEPYVDSSSAAEDVKHGLEAARYNIPLEAIDMGIPGEYGMSKDSIYNLKISARAGNGNIKEFWDTAEDGSNALQLFIEGDFGRSFAIPTWKNGPNAGKPIVMPFDKFTENWVVARRGYQFLDDYEPLFESPSEGDFKSTKMHEELSKFVYSTEVPRDKSKWYFLGTTWGSKGKIEKRVLKMLEKEARVQHFMRTQQPGTPTDGDILVAIDKLQDQYFGPGKQIEAWQLEYFRQREVTKSNRRGIEFKNVPSFWQKLNYLYGLPGGMN
ncbi:hypothetical protein [uncultured Mediterranean phage uvMED]|nr:hypothetical protein [uncultured Mediterranean phage uvMED]